MAAIQFGTAIKAFSGQVKAFTTNGEEDSSQTIRPTVDQKIAFSGQIKAY